MTKEAVLRAMVSMAEADEILDQCDIEHVCEIYHEVTNEAISPDEVVSAAEARRDGSFQALPYLRDVKNELDIETKEQLIKATYRVLISDGKVAAQERKKLGDIARAIGMREIHYKAVLEDVEH